MTVTCVSEMLMLPPSQGYVAFDIPPTTAATFAIVPTPLGQSVSMPFASQSSPALHSSIPANGTPEAQYQHRMELA